MVGTRVETLMRTLGAFAKDGLIKLDRKSIEIQASALQQEVRPYTH